MKKNLNLILFVVVIIFIVIKSGAIEKMSVSSISPNEVSQLVEQKKAILIDVREEDEVKSGMIDRALWIAKSKFDSKDSVTLSEINKLDKSKEILLYCRSGNRAGKMGAELQKMGFKVKNAGGFDSLKAIGMKIKN